MYDTKYHTQREYKKSQAVPCENFLSYICCSLGGNWLCTKLRSRHVVFKGMAGMAFYQTVVLLGVTTLRLWHIHLPDFNPFDIRGTQ
jgi:hypothetical protein